MNESSSKVKMDTSEHDVMTVHEAAQYLRISRRTVYRLAEARRIPAKKVGSQWRFSQSALAKFLGVPTAKSEPEPERKSAAPRFDDNPQMERIRRRMRGNG